jgi:hypothetical protein
MKKRFSSSSPKEEPSRVVLLRRRCACGQHTGGGECEECRRKGEKNPAGMLQRKLAVGPPGDACEREADRVAESVVADRSGAPSRISAAPSSLRRSAEAEGPGDAPAVVGEALRSPGQPLSPGVRAFMEPRIGHDFSRVRVHTGELAARSARSVDALAYTVGSDIVFGAGQYVPETPAGRGLLAHELTHVVQQRGGNGILQRTSLPGEPPPGGHDTLPYREAMGLMNCIEKLGEGSEAYCREQVLEGGMAPEMWGAGGPVEGDKEKTERKPKTHSSSHVTSPKESKKADHKSTVHHGQPWSMEMTTGAGGEVSRQWKSGEKENENVSLGVIGIAFEKEEGIALGIEIEGGQARETAPDREPETSHSTKFSPSLRIPVKPRPLDPKSVIIVKTLSDLTVKCNLSFERPEAPDGQKVRSMECELKASLFAFEWKKRGLELGLKFSPFVSGEIERVSNHWNKALTFGAELGADLKWHPGGGLLFLQLEPSAKLTVTPRGGVLEGAAVLKLGVTIPLSIEQTGWW